MEKEGGKARARSLSLQATIFFLREKEKGLEYLILAESDSYQGFGVYEMNCWWWWVVVVTLVFV